MKIWIFFKRFFLPLIPLLILYIGIIWSEKTDTFTGDEYRYYKHAEWMLERGYFINADDPEFHAGPGYPIVLLPFVAAKTHLIWIELLNAFFLFGALGLLNMTYRRYLPAWVALALAYLMGLQPMTIENLDWVTAEYLAIFLLSALMYLISTSFRSGRLRPKWMALAVAVFGYLILTKVFFAYVALALFVAGIVFWMIYRWPQAKKLAILSLGAYLFCTPWLLYTYSITGRVNYWSTSGGEQLYFHASPYEHEFGDWFANRRIFHPDDEDRYCGISSLSANHLEFYSTLPFASSDTNMTDIYRDQLFKEEAIRLMKAHPVKYLRNTVASASRLFFAFPYSYTPQKLATLKYVVPNMFILVLFVLFAIPAWVGRRKIPLEIWVMLLMFAVFVGGITLLNGNVRHLGVVLPIPLLFLAYIGFNVLQIKINKE